MFLKRFLSALLCLPLLVVACLATVALTSGPKSSSALLFDGVRGDLDGDGIVSAYDLALYLQHLSGVSPLPDGALTVADLNGDGKTDDADVQLQQQYLSGGDVSVGLRVAYVPLDNRPINQERVIFLAQAIGIELVMPEEHLYRTALDNMEPNPNGETIGDRKALLEWLKEADKTCDAFIISMDQMLSGGLVGSRWLDNTDLSFEYEIIDEIARLCEENTVILFDIVMRLASTSGYDGLGSDVYNALRKYGMQARKQLYGEDLTMENIIAGYRYDENGKTIPFSAGDEILDHYLRSRERKLLLADYLLRNAGDKMEYLFIGTDDSYPQTTIQTNELRYLDGMIGDRGIVYGGTDELGLSFLARMATLLYGSPQVHLTYYGPGKDLPSDEFDIGSLGDTIDSQLIRMNVEQTDKTKNTLQVLILTRDNTLADRKALMKQLETNLYTNVPTTLIDASGRGEELAAMLFNETDLPIGQLFGYSCWNTAGNASGTALAIGVGRYAYLSAVLESTPAANEGFLKTMAFAYVKDISYKRFHPYIEGIEKEDYTCSVPLILRRLNASKIITSLSSYKKITHDEVTVSNFRYPWNRTFEMTFDVEVG